MDKRKLVILHYAGISRNKTSGVSVVVPQIVNAQVEVAKVGLYNYGSNSFPLNKAVRVWGCNDTDNYRCFEEPYNKPDLVVFHSPFGIAKVIHLINNIQNDKISLIVVPHGCFSKNALKKKYIKKMLAINFFFRKMIKEAAAIQYLSKGEKESSIIHGKSIIVPNGIDVPSETEKKTSNKIVFSFIGRKDIHHKGLDILIQACAMLDNDIKENVIINIYGPDDGKSINDLIEKYRVNNVVKSYPAVFDEEKKKVFQNTDVFVLTSRYEGQPVAVLEAWANGCPALLTPGTNMSDETIKNNCGWIADEDPLTIANSIRNIYENRNDILEKSNKAKEYVLNEYNWKKIGQRYIQAYERVLNNDKY